MTWNIKTGGVDRGGGDRLAAIAAVVAGSRPDVLALQELRGFGRRMPAFARSAGMIAHVARPVFGQPVAVLVRPPLWIAGRASMTWRLHHAAAVVTVPTDAGPLTVVSTHLNPYSVHRRRREAVRLAVRYAGRGLVVVTGDLNSLAPGTVLAPDALPPAYRRRHVDRYGTVNTEAIQAFLRAGLTDVWPTVGAGDGCTVPTAYGDGHEFARARLDYILAGPRLADRARRAFVVRGGEVECASDHYPLCAEFDLTSRASR